MSKTLVILLAETRASEITYENIKTNLIDELNADLCICVGKKADYDFENPFYKNSQYQFIYDEPENYADAFEYAYRTILKEKMNVDPDNVKSSIEKIKDVNSIFGKNSNLHTSVGDITYRGNHTDLTNYDFSKVEDAIFVHYTPGFGDHNWKNRLYSIRKGASVDYFHQYNVDTYRRKKYSHWRDLFALGEQFMGGVIEDGRTYEGSAGISVFFRWFLLKNLLENDLISKYDRFIVTRSDYIYKLPHPKMNLLDEKYVWIPDCEDYWGYTARHAILSKHNISSYLNIFETLITSSNKYIESMNTTLHVHNLETLMKHHLMYNGLGDLIKRSPYVMYAVRATNGTTRWSLGVWSDKYQYYIKYPSEYDRSGFYKSKYDEMNASVDGQLSMDTFYKEIIPTITNS